MGKELVQVFYKKKAYVNGQSEYEDAFFSLVNQGNAS